MLTDIRDSAIADAHAIAPLLENPPPRSVAEVLNELRFTGSALEEAKDRRTELMVRITLLHEEHERVGCDAINLGQRKEQLRRELEAAVDAEVAAERERKMQARGLAP